MANGSTVERPSFSLCRIFNVSECGQLHIQDLLSYSCVLASRAVQCKLDSLHAFYWAIHREADVVRIAVSYYKKNREVPPIQDALAYRRALFTDPL